MMRWFSSLLVFAFLTSASGLRAQVLGVEEDSLFSLVLAEVDLADATRVMTVHDRNDDGFIDQGEQKSLSWSNQVDSFDATKDRRLTHLEVAMRFASLRAQAGVEQEHVDNATVYLRRHDRNRNGQLDPDEILNGWPKDPDAFDVNSDGVISLGEIARRFAYMGGLRKEMGIERVDQVTAIRTVRKFDQDKDQRLDTQEQRGAFLPLSPDSFDEDGDGKLGIQEIATMLARYRRQTKMSGSDLAQLRSLFEQFDANADGIIGKEEVQAASRFQVAAGSESMSGPMDAALKRFDVDKDGQLTLQEVGTTLIKQRAELGFSDQDLAEARKLLTRHDNDRSNHIEERELFESPSDGQLSRNVLQAADQDEDKRLSLIELAKMMAGKRSGDD